MRLEYVNEEEKQLRIVEIEAVLENNLCENRLEKYRLEVEKQFLEGNCSPFNDLVASVEMETGETFEMTNEIRTNQFSLIFHNKEGYPELPYHRAETVDDLLQIVICREKGYRFMSPAEVVRELESLPFGDSVDFTFDTPDDENDVFEPSGWYGVKKVNLFDEMWGVLCFGMYGGGYNTRVEEITEPKEIEEIFRRFLEDEADRHVEILCVSNKHNGQ